MNRNVCARCGKPVYFAERKTSLGRDWHPSCLKCTECGRVLSPGQHAEHKGKPYCHTPCYKALFGPALLGYGSNIASPANFAKKDGPAQYGHDYEDDVYKREIYSNTKISAIRRQKQRQSAPKSILNHDFSVPNSVSSTASNSLPAAANRHASADVASQSPSSASHSGHRARLSPKLRDIVDKVQAFNSHYEGKVHHQMTVEQLPNGEVLVQGPLRIYWGLSRPIQLRQCDDIPNPPIAKWRHSLCGNIENTPQQKTSLQDIPESPKHLLSPNRQRRGIDDSVIMSPSSTDDVVMRRRPIRKFNTVAYRSDAPTKWKRASINGHIFNYDTSVFTPVLGSSTSVIADSSMPVPVVIETLLEKFKVENSPSEYVLSVVSENTERLLGESDKPLLERLELGADDQSAKIFIKERKIEPEVTVPDTSIQLPIMTEEEEEETLPEEVEQLLILPVAALTGVLKKYKQDEEREVRILKAKYERVRRKIRKRMEELKTA